MPMKNGIIQSTTTSPIKLGRSTVFSFTANSRAQSRIDDIRIPDVGFRSGPLDYPTVSPVPSPESLLSPNAALATPEILTDLISRTKPVAWVERSETRGRPHLRPGASPCRRDLKHDATNATPQTVDCSCACSFAGTRSLSFSRARYRQLKRAARIPVPIPSGRG